MADDDNHADATASVDALDGATPTLDGLTDVERERLLSGHTPPADVPDDLLDGATPTLDTLVVDDPHAEGGLLDGGDGPADVLADATTDDSGTDDATDTTGL